MKRLINPWKTINPSPKKVLLLFKLKYNPLWNGCEVTVKNSIHKHAVAHCTMTKTANFVQKLFCLFCFKKLKNHFIYNWVSFLVRKLWKTNIHKKFNTIETNLIDLKRQNYLIIFGQFLTKTATVGCCARWDFSSLSRKRLLRAWSFETLIPAAATVYSSSRHSGFIWFFYEVSSLLIFQTVQTNNENIKILWYS